MSESPKPDMTAWTTPATPQQAAMMTATGDLMAAWMRRRQEALETGIQALQQMSACPDPASATRVFAEWMSGSMNRILADISDAQRASQAMFASQAAATVAAMGEPAPPKTPAAELRKAA